MKPIVVFDLGGVLIDWNPRYLYRKFFTDEPHMEFFLREVVSPNWNHEMDAGRPMMEAVTELAHACPQYREAIYAWKERWGEMLGDAIEPMPQVLSHLANKGWELHAITNWSDETFPFARSRFEFLDRFRSITISGRERAAKPNPLIFEIFLERHSLKAKDCLFIDDVPRNLDCAYAVGFETLHFTDPRSCITQLAELLNEKQLLNLLPPEEAHDDGDTDDAADDTESTEEQ